MIFDELFKARLLLAAYFPQPVKQILFNLKLL